MIQSASTPELQTEYLRHHQKLFFIGDERETAREANCAELADSDHRGDDRIKVGFLFGIEPQHPTGHFEIFHFPFGALDILRRVFARHASGVLNYFSLQNRSNCIEIRRL